MKVMLFTRESPIKKNEKQATRYESFTKIVRKYPTITMGSATFFSVPVLPRRSGAQISRMDKPYPRKSIYPRVAILSSDQHTMSLSVKRLFVNDWCS